MALPTAYSLVFSLALAVLTFAAMQVFKDELSVEGRMNILGGFIGSWFFIFFTNVIGNCGTLLLGETYYVKLFPEAIFSLVVTMVISGSVHRVCATTSLIFSLIALYYINKISQSTYTVKPSQKPAPKTTTKSQGRSKNK